MKILLVEDMVGEPIRMVLERSGHDVYLAKTLAETRWLLQESSFDLFLFDWMLPDGSGLELVRELRSEQRFVQVPVLMVSSKTNRDDIVIAIGAGIDGYLAKPFKATDLRSRINEIWQRQSCNRTKNQQVELLLTQQDPMRHGDDRPLVLFGEGSVSEDMLLREENSHVLDYLVAATTAIAAANAFNPKLELGYRLVSSTGEVTRMQKESDISRRVRLTVVSTSCHGNCVLMARLIRMHSPDKANLCIVSDHFLELTGIHRSQLVAERVQVLERHELDTDRWRDILDGYVVSDWDTELAFPSL